MPRGGIDLRESGRCFKTNLSRHFASNHTSRKVCCSVGANVCHIVRVVLTCMTLRFAFVLVLSIHSYKRASSLHRCPKCNGYLGIVVPERKGRRSLLKCGYFGAWVMVRGKTSGGDKPTTFQRWLILPRITSIDVMFKGLLLWHTHCAGKGKGHE
jgi:hypothetical protein